MKRVNRIRFADLTVTPEIFLAGIYLASIQN